MKPLFDALLFLVWVAVYLTAVFWIARYRKTKARALGPALHTEYRTDKDIALRLLIFVLGVVLLLLGYVATRAVGQYL
jgi:hypothetical protein